jgi:DNA-binding NarL/FixJ family response regulator
VPEANVLLLTGDDDPRLVGRAIEAGCMGFLTKDRAITELLDAVYTLAAGDAFVPGDLLTHLLPTLGRSQQGLGSDLTPRELEVLRLAAAGMANSSIAATLYLSVNTIRNHVQNAITKLGAHSKLEAVTLALRERLIDLTPP